MKIFQVRKTYFRRDEAHDAREEKQNLFFNTFHNIKYCCDPNIIECSCRQRIEIK
jgi:hypothetical protein